MEMILQLGWTLGAFLLAIGLVVTFHEFGHYWVARRCGVRVLTFSVGFGRPLWSWRGKDGTRYQIAMIPLGGYVRMLDGRVDKVAEQDKKDSFDQKSVQKRIAVVIAGPVFNFIFALAALWLMLVIGVPSMRPVVGDVAENSIAAQAGLQTGEQIIQIDGRRTQEWQAVNLALVERIGSQRSIWTVENAGGDQRQIEMNLRDWQFDPESQSTISSLGIQLFQPELFTTLAEVMDNSPAAQGGLRAGDKIVAVNGTKVEDWEQIRSFIAGNPRVAAQFTVERQGGQEELTVNIGDQQGTGFVGVIPQSEPYPEAYWFRLQYGPLAAIPHSFDRTWQLMTLTVGMLKKLITGDVSVKNLSGPVGIAIGAGDHASYGVVYFLSFLALISVSLGILNLLPIPVLDGGHLMYYIIEWVRGKPVPEHVQAIGFRVGMILLFALMALALFNDISRLTP